VESIAGIASCGLKRHLQILVVNMRRCAVQKWVLIYSVLAPYGDDEALRMKEKNRGVYRT